MRYGGNTSCLEVRCGDRLLIFDAGTGLHSLGSKLMANGAMQADLFFSHTHFDHICGFPFFAPAFRPDNALRIWAGHLLPERTVREVLIYLMMDPLFPVPIDTMRAKMTFCDFVAGEELSPYEDVTIRTAPLNHPNGATGYRVEYQGKSICYITDTEHVPGHPDENIIGLIRGADIVIYDCTYTDDEYPSHVNWGHSTWQEGARLAEAADVKTFVVFHHDPDHDDDFMDSIATQLAKIRPGSIVAQEGMTLRP
ncbi:MAG: MBL fold metallo-hydrolase [Rhodospirillaceae bacterium]|nr:MBL fold metallo-hydrolase [Rhodospirillaceae bacterium]